MHKSATASPRLTKRQFMKLCGLGLCGYALGCDQMTAFLGKDTAQAEPLFGTDGLWKWSREALFCAAEEGGVRCRKCPHGCLLGPDDIGICRNRVNYQGKMYSIAYGNPCAVHVDPVEKKPLYHFLPGTRAYSIAAAGCNLRCLNCQNWEISQVNPRQTQNADLMPEQVVEACLAARCESIAFTYSEPTTFYEYAYDTAKLAREKKLRTIWKSNGYINEEPLRQLCKVIDAANIDLKSFDETIYQKLNSARLAPVLNTLKTFSREGVWLEITNLVIPTWTDDLEMIRRMCDWLCANGLRDCPLHFSRFTPLYKLNQLPSTPVSVLDNALAIARKAGMHYVFIGNVPGHQAENTYCHRCARLIIERRGFRIAQFQVKEGRCAFCNEKVPGVWS